MEWTLKALKIIKDAEVTKISLSEAKALASRVQAWRSAGERGSERTSLIQALQLRVSNVIIEWAASG